MAANELAAHASLQPPTVAQEPQHVSLLLGGFSPTAGPTAGEQVCNLRVVISICHKSPAVHLHALMSSCPEHISQGHVTP